MRRYVVTTGVLGLVMALASCGGETERLDPARSTEIAPDDLSYPDPNMFTQGVPIPELVPTVRGMPTNYMVSPELPAGLRLTWDGRITGTPTEPRGPGTYLVTAGNSAGTSSFGVRITVIGRFTIGGYVSGLSGTGLVLTNNGGDALAVNADGPFTFATPLAAGSTYAVAIAAQPAGAHCQVARGGGLVANIDVGDVAITCASSGAGKAVADAGLFAACLDRVALLGELTYAFDIDRDAGDDRVPLPGCDADLVTVGPDGSWVYVEDPATGMLSVYAFRPRPPVAVTFGRGGRASPE